MIATIIVGWIGMTGFYLALLYAHGKREKTVVS